MFLVHQHELFWRFRLPVANKELFQIESDYSISNENLFGHLGAWLITAIFSSMRVLYLLWHALNNKLWRVLPQVPTARPVFNYAYTMPTIGVSGLWQPDSVTFFSWQIVETLKWRQQFDEYRPARLRKDKHRYSEQLRMEMGIPLTDWFVCLHVREYKPHADPEFVDYRNASIPNYIEGIKVITDAGGWVVRIGDKSMTPLPHMERVIDYPFTRFKSELMDLYLFSQCRFYIGSSSGPYDAAVLFGKRQIGINITSWSLGFPIRKGDLALIKHIYSRSRARFLSVKEILDEPFECQSFFSLSSDYIMLENTSEEIRDVITEFLSKSDDYEVSDIQKDFNEGRRQQIHRWLDQGAPFWPGTNHIIEQYRIASRSDSSDCTLGQSYLELNWLKDHLNEDDLAELPLSLGKT